jgi:hypothetical protein
LGEGREHGELFWEEGIDLALWFGGGGRFSVAGYVAWVRSWKIHSGAILPGRFRLA